MHHIHVLHKCICKVCVCECMCLSLWVGSFSILQHQCFTKIIHLYILHDGIQRLLWGMGGRLSIRGALLKMGIRNLDPRSKPKLAGYVDGDEKSKGKENSLSDFWKRMSETNLLVPHLGISVAVLFCCCFLSNMLFPLSIKKKESVLFIE